MAADLPTLLWRDMDLAARAVAYSPSSALEGPIDPFIQAYADKSQAAYAACENVQTLRYGGKAANTVDVVCPPGAGPVPILVFIHGGYWQQLSKRDAFFPALGALSRGMAYSSVDYTLCPAATLDDIVDECRAAVQLLVSKADALGIDPDRIVLAGSSAGAQLAAMVALRLAQGGQIAGVVLLSGVFELEPLIGTYINDAVGLDTEAALRNSPALQDLGHFPPALVAWGAQETDEFKRQSRRFAALLQRAGRTAEVLEVAGRNHFDIVEDITAGTDLGHRMAALIGM